MPNRGRSLYDPGPFYTLIRGRTPYEGRPVWLNETDRYQSDGIAHELRGRDVLECHGPATQDQVNEAIELSKLKIIGGR